MPPVREIDLSDGIRIVLLNGQEINLLRANFPSVNSAEELSEALTSTLQRMLEKTYKRNTWDSDHRLRQNPPTLRVWEHLQGGNVIVTLMWVAVHVYNYPVTSSSDYTIRCQNAEAGPITGEW